LQQTAERRIRRFGRSAAICRKAGFSGVEIHGARGYLVSQFWTFRDLLGFSLGGFVAQDASLKAPGLVRKPSYPRHWSFYRNEYFVDLWRMKSLANTTHHRSKRNMKALTFKRYGKSPEIGFAEMPRPTLKPDELLVEVHAAGVNPIDNMITTGMFKPVLKVQLPATMGSDLAGIVIDVGSRVTRFKKGDAIFASLFDLGRGSIAEFAVVPESAAAPKPVNLDFVQAASVPMVGLTSWQALKERANLQPGQKVFIPAGSGGIGTLAIQLAKHFGAKVGTNTSTGNIPLVKGLSADEVIDYKKQAFEKVLRDYDVVLGTIRGDAVEKSVGILKPGGKIVSLIGPLDAAFARARGLNFALKFVFGLMSRKIMRLARKRDVTYSFLFVRPDGAQLAEIGKLLESERIHPVIDKVFPFEQAKEALEYLAQGRAKGKVVVKIK
jgi:NADPH:quinone reductase-like Zn-dependent oxidoreductase